MPAKALLFDLDGTLLPVRQEFFIKDYPEAAAPYFEEFIPPELFKKALIKSTYDMVNNLDPGLSNMDAFRISFERLVGVGWDKLWPAFRRFYTESFPNLRKVVPQSDTARKVVLACLDMGWEIVLATNALFPEMAIRERMRWCGIDDLPWKFVPDIEVMHFCKPHLQYYEELLEITGLDPKRCIMIGNDVQEDVVAARLGMKTILVEDFCIDRSESGDPGALKPDMRGTLEQVPEMVRKIYEANIHLYT